VKAVKAIKAAIVAGADIKVKDIVVKLKKEVNIKVVATIALIIGRCY
jgi:CO dehydrogenase/acetyl-CoA synthase epsilon subunit